MKDIIYLCLIGILLVQIFFLQECRTAPDPDPEPCFTEEIIQIDTHFVVAAPVPIQAYPAPEIPDRPANCPPCGSDTVRIYREAFSIDSLGLSLSVESSVAGSLQSQWFSVQARPTIYRPQPPVSRPKTNHLYLTGGLSIGDFGAPVGLYYAPDRGLALWANYDYFRQSVQIGVGIRLVSWR